MDYGFLKSGTDVRGVASDIRGKRVELTDDAVYDIVSAFVVWFEKHFDRRSDTLKIAVGHDSRITAERISKAVCHALSDSGVHTVYCGMASTPAMFMTTVDIDTDAAIQITASHHPSDRNGLKFFLPDGGLEASQISEILNIASKGERVSAAQNGVVESFDYMPMYCARLRNMICKEASRGERPLEGYHIVVDAGNGVGGFYATEVLQKLGADISGSRYLGPDGLFPNHIPNPENAYAMKSICDAVKKSGADLGIIFDTDVDRAGCVGGDGEPINRNRLIALASYIALKGSKGGTVVTDSVTSDGLKEYIENDLGGVHFRYKRGYKNVIEKAVELNAQGVDCPLAIETSGHAALRENYFLDDGAYLVTKIVIELARGTDIEGIIKPLQLPKEELEIRLKINADDFRSVGERVIAELTAYATEKSDYTIVPDNYEGVRISTKDGWFLLRLSVHDPVIPINFESNVSGGIKNTVAQLLPFLERFNELDLSEAYSV